jgi:hypothetical protein
VEVPKDAILFKKDHYFRVSVRLVSRGHDMKVQFLASALTVFHLLQPNTLSLPRSATSYLCTVVCPNSGLNATYQVCPLVAHFHVKASLAGALLARDVTC